MINKYINLLEQKIQDSFKLCNRSIE